MKARACEDLARRAAPGAWFSLVVLVILAAATHYATLHPVVFYSVLIAHVALALVRLWLFNERTRRFANRLHHWRALVCTSIVVGGAVWGFFAAVTNVSHCFCQSWDGAGVCADAHDA